MAARTAARAVRVAAARAGALARQPRDRTEEDVVVGGGEGVAVVAAAEGAAVEMVAVAA